MVLYKKIVFGTFVLAFLVMSAVPVCGQSDFGSADPSGVHHLGDQTMSDWEVPKSEGTAYTTTFSLTAVPASADIILDVFNTNYNNPVLVNGNSVGILCINTIEGWKQCTIKIPGSALRVGSNTLTIQSESRDRNYDDFMIRNIEVTPSSDAQPATPTPTPPEFSVVLVFESRSKSSGSTLQIPLTLTGATDKIGNMDVTLGYDPSVLEATEVIKGGLTTTSLFEYNLTGAR